MLLWDRPKLEKMIAQTNLEVEFPKLQARDSLILWSGSPLLRRGGIALKDKDWKKAHQFFDRVLNTDPENAEAYLGFVMAEAEWSDLDYFMEIYINAPYLLNQLNQNNLRHAKEFAGPELCAWFTRLETQQKDTEDQRKRKAEQFRKDYTFIDTKMLLTEQERNEVYKQVILAYLSANPELVVTAPDIVESVLRPAYPNELWSNQKSAALLHTMCDKYDRDSGELTSEGKLKIIHVKGIEGKVVRLGYILKKDVL